MLAHDNAESRLLVENCVKRYKVTINPIVDWTDAEVWEFIRVYNIPYCELYDEGWHRLGCIGCPMAGRRGRERGFNRWPKYKNYYLRAFERVITKRKADGKKCFGIWESPETLFNWWMEYDIAQGQIAMFE